MKVSKIVINRRASEGFFGRVKKFIELGSLPNGKIIDIKHQITAVLGNNGSGKSQLLSGIAEKRKYLSNAAYAAKDTQLFDIYDSEGNLQPHLSVSINEVSQPKDRPNKKSQNGFFDGTDKELEFVQATNYDPETLDYQQRSQVSSGQFMFSQTIKIVLSAGNESVLLMDEPDAHLDETYKNQLINSLSLALKKGVQLFIVSHNPLFLTALQEQSELGIGVISFKDKYTAVETMDWEDYVALRAAEGSFEYGLVKKITSSK